ncbi:MAG TPA: peptidoglycan DD-metalloendopeptidase family protein [Thermoflexia bacterium]|nr:peptidoglycan DD-metalloendopeptidase family protein [Thermoflexia bacterium]
MWPRILLCWFLILTFFPVGKVSAQVAVPSAAPELPTHIVQPGETLFSIAQRHGVELRSLVRANGISDPRQIYVGQQLQLASPLASVDMRSWSPHSVQLGEELSLLSRGSRYDLRTVAGVNHILNPDSLLVGESVLLPERAEPLSLRLAGNAETQLGLALRQGIPFWQVAALNPAPLYPGATVALPGDDASDFLPYPVTSLTLSAQPVERGQTTVLVLETADAVTCEVTYLERTEPCYLQNSTHLYALVSLSPMLEPAAYEIKLRVHYQETELAFKLPLVVTPGRFGFERIDVPPGKEALFDPALLRGENALVNMAADLHTPERYWQAPFDYPVQAAVSSYFGSRRSYGGSYNSYHSGVDFRAATGAPIHTPASGTVVLAEKLTVRGNAVIIDHGWGVSTGYWHLSQIDVEVGQYVSKSEVIGLVGNTGLSTGSHLHWQLWASGEPVDPLQWVDDFYDFPAPVPANATAMQ